MSRENVDLAVLMYEAFNRRDLEGMLALMHDEVEIEPRLGALEGDYRGHEGVRRWWSNLLGSSRTTPLQSRSWTTSGHDARTDPGYGTRCCQLHAGRRDLVAVDPVERREVHLVA
jgi:ketosteroid isomerase-like protein